jgi:hypothetical protein
VGTVRELAIGEILGAVPPEPPVGTVLSTQRLATEAEGGWEPVIERREDGWHLVTWSGGTPMTWPHAFDSFRPLRVERVSHG